MTEVEQSAMSFESMIPNSESAICDKLGEAKNVGDVSNIPSDANDKDEALPNVKSPQNPSVINTEENSETKNLNTGISDSADDEWMDILGNGDFKKKVIRPGLGAETRPERGDEVTASISYYVNDTLFEENDNVKFILGDMDVIQGVDLVTALLEKEEISRVKIPSKLAYGSLGRSPHVPPDTDIECQIEIKDVKQLSEDSLTLTKCLELGNEKRDRGNTFFQCGEYINAIHCYERAAAYLEDIRNGSASSPEELQKALEVKIKVWNNMAVSHLKLGAYGAALKSVDSVLRLQPNNVKALFRKGKILVHKGSTDEAIACLKKAASLDADKTIQTELNSLLKRKKKEEESQKAMYKRMFQQSEPKKPSRISKLIKWSTIASTGAVLAGVAGVVMYRFIQS